MSKGISALIDLQKDLQMIECQAQTMHPDYGFAPRTCAHDKRCSGFTPMISIPLGINERDF